MPHSAKRDHDGIATDCRATGSYRRKRFLDGPLGSGDSASKVTRLGGANLAARKRQILTDREKSGLGVFRIKKYSQFLFTHVDP